MFDKEQLRIKKLLIAYFTRRVISMLNSISWSRNNSHGTKLTVYNAIVKSILIYGQSNRNTEISY
jgi:hypothetical protein